MADIGPASPELADLRSAVRQVAEKYGHRYFVAQHSLGLPESY